MTPSPDPKVSSLIPRVVTAAVVAAVLGGGAMIVDNARTNSVQDSRIQRLEVTMDRIDALTTTWATTNANVAVLNANIKSLEQRLDREEARHVARD